MALTERPIPTTDTVDPDLVGRRVEAVAGVGDAGVATKVVPAGPRGLWAALCRGETEAQAKTPVGRELDLRASDAHLGYLASLDR